MFDSIYDFAGKILDFFYGLVPNYGIAIMLMTMLVMLVTTPLTLKGTRGMIRMQLLQPELKKIQEKHKGGDRQEMNAELMAFYQENNLNPLGGCLPLLVQAPVFFLLFRLIRGITRSTVEACPANVADGVTKCFHPDHLDVGSKLYNALEGQTKMMSFGIDLAESTSHALGQSIVHGLPYLALILLMIGAQYLQQKQISARNPDGNVTMPQQKILLRVMPAFFGIISINFPAALVVYWVTSSIYRIGLQGYITHSLYAGEESLGAQANKAAAKARAMKEKEKADKGGGSDNGSDNRSDNKAKRTRPDSKGSNGKGSNSKGSAGTGSAGKGPDDPGSGGRAAGIGGGSRAGGTDAGKYQPASKKKKRKRR